MSRWYSRFGQVYKLWFCTSHLQFRNSRLTIVFCPVIQTQRATP